MKQCILAGLLLLFSFINAVFAHSPVRESIPQDGSILASAPEALIMHFGDPARITKVTLVHKSATDAFAADLEVTEKNFVRTIKFTPKWSGAGDYVVEWRVLGDDGHAMKGSFAFTITGE